jgi:hypothetical protein
MGQNRKWDLWGKAELAAIFAPVLLSVFFVLSFYSANMALQPLGVLSGCRFFGLL